MSYTLLEGDCLELMPSIEDNSVDMILCDLPYGTTQNKWDTIIPFEPLWKEYERIIKDNGAIVLTASQPFTSALVMSNPKMFRYEWIWHKNIPTGFLNANKMPMKQHENVLVFYKKLPLYNPIFEDRTESGKERCKYVLRGSGPSNNYGEYERTIHQPDPNKRFPSTVQRINVEKGLHSTQKPVALFEYLIKTYTNENDLVLDNCAGSGTTGVACHNLNRDCILIEQEPEYIQVIKDRMQKTIGEGRQTTLGLEAK
jgi:site-specific DNA-methyltransferase (adenine-specific)